MRRNSGIGVGLVVEIKPAKSQAVMACEGPIVILRLVADISERAANHGEFDAGTGQGWVELTQAVDTSLPQCRRAGNEFRRFLGCCKRTN